MRLLILLLLAFACASVNALCVTTSGAVLRKGPGKSHPVTWRVNRHMPLVDLEYKNGWYKVEDLDGQVHWIYKATVSKNYQCMAVRVPQAALRKGPGTNQPYADLPTVGKYYSFKRVDFDPPWFQVEDDRKGKYWIHENLIWQPMKRHRVTF